ncbi:MAG: hypothetical protein H8K10_13825 [Nitrospira sp.]|nr:hypothetical protein [Nitrospira sp.]
MLLSIAVVGGAAAYYSSIVSTHGAWAAVGGWSLTALYVVCALAGGALAGVLSAAQQTVERLELMLRDWLHTLPAMQSTATSAGRSLATARQEYEAMVDRCVTQTAGCLKLPRWLEKLIRTALQGAVVDRFIASCTDRGLHLVAPQEFRNWLLAEGVSLGFMPVQDQLAWWRYLILGLLGLLAAMVLALALLNN